MTEVYLKYYFSILVDSFLFFEIDILAGHDAWLGLVSYDAALFCL